ncbi:sugar phosphate isomerase/epimerase [Longilinea arvoryzae]|uniref:Sugar phosphate isomerase/epimerase n=1 Tax=Longilinea arvoryzae TaxID=360412 RepID=A0A0S7BFW5_9CHLR|nr:sugar phosphate isomerase/epimerase [Longilinea arvoryzae]GAP12673.1 sugar phosphate isomerase/epimerase [Longilinea arvoryzae]
MNRIVAVNSNCYHGYSIEEAIDGIRTAGFHFIELTATKGWTEHVFPTMSFNDLNSVKDRLDDAGLVAFSMSGHTNLMDTERIGDFINNMRLANFFGCDTIVSSIGEAHLKDQAVATNEEVARHIQNLLPYLEEYDLDLVLENHGEHATGQIIKEIVELVGSRRVWVNYDTANVIYFAGVNPLADLPRCVDKVGYMHIKDKIGGKGEWNFPALGKGEIDFPAILGLLDEAGNDCPLSIEIEFTSAGSKDLAEVNQAVRDSYDYLKDLGLNI